MKSKITPCPTLDANEIWRSSDRLASVQVVRWVPVVVASVVSLVATTAAADGYRKPSNPAFLGVGMNDLGGVKGAGPCMITTITRDSPAQLAGLKANDILVSIDRSPIANCDALLSKIQQRAPGDAIRIEVRRNDMETPLAMTATLLTREEVLRRRGIVGQPVPATSLTAVDGSAVDLSDVRSGITIIGWFDAGCAACATSFIDVSRWARKHATRSNPVRVMGAIGNDRTSPEEALEELKLVQKSFDVPLVLVDSDTRNDLTVSDAERVYFMVIDARGVVRHVAPVAPGADDADVMLDELFATAEQCARRAK